MNVVIHEAIRMDCSNRAYVFVEFQQKKMPVILLLK